MAFISVREENFDIGEEQKALLKESNNTGAEILFVGRVRDFVKADLSTHKPSVSALFLSHYQGMTETAIKEICTEAETRWQLSAIRVIHRIGELHTGEQIVLVAVSAAHRAEAFSGAEFIMDELKTRATFWKKEIRSDGEYWLDMKESDKKRAARWQSDTK